MIAGLQKMTLLDYPGKIACTVFLQGCNFRCPFCHNSGLLGAAEQPAVSIGELLDFLRKRQGLLDGVCITGGEPTLCRELPEWIAEIKNLGFAVKLDTNGSRPEMLKSLAQQGLLDYVAMDIKNCPAKYPETTGVSDPKLGKIRQSMEFLMTGDLDYEFRTTVVEEFHCDGDFQAMGEWFREIAPNHPVKKFFIQPYTDRDSVLVSGLHTPKATKIKGFLENIKPYVHRAEIRGFDT